MPLPNPAYLTQQPYNWDATTKAAVLVATSAAISGSKRSIRWEACDAYDRDRIHELLIGYNDRAGAPVTEANIVTGFIAASAYQTIDFDNSALGANVTGLIAGTDYTFSVVYNGTEYFYSVNGTNSDTFTNLIAAMDAAMTGDGIATVLFDDNIEIVSDAAASGHVVEAFDGDLFASINGFKSIKELRVGITTIADVFDLNFRTGYQSFAELLIGKLENIPNKAPRSTHSTTDVYYNHGTSAWLLSLTDIAPV